MKKYLPIICVILGIVLIIVLICCLRSCSSDPNAGIYYGVYVDAEGSVYRMEDFYNGDNYLELESGGDAVMMINETKHKLEWSLEDGILTFVEAGDPFYGYLSEGVIVLDYMSWGLNLTFALEGAQVPETTYGEEYDEEAWQETLASMQAFWNGDWYGWWYISEGTGDYAKSTGSWWDAAATIEIDDEARGSIVLWDTEHSRSDPLSDCVLRIYQEGSNGTMGIALSGQGSFMGSAVKAGDWLIDPSTAPYENLIEINGYYEDEDGYFFYTVFLRPWGQLWDDVKQANNPNVLPDVLPASYEWYLQAIANGEGLPDKLGK